ncbi:hypothetical protein CSB20_13190 [bacterium DOLZORAL124_64_63]|nr:MAG: hypothetical protein CSB20_13190 [bacterium DOLZORAL124_64_63]
MNPRIILSMIRLRLLRVLRDPTSLIWLLLMPMVFSLLMGQLMGDWSRGNADKPRFMVYDADGGAASDRLLAPLYDQENFRLVRADSVIASSTARRLVEKGRITAALFIPAGFTAAVDSGAPVTLELHYDSDRLSSQTVRTLLDERLLETNVRAGAATLVAPPGPDGRRPAGTSPAFDEAVFQHHWRQPRIQLEATTLGRRADSGLKLTRASQHVGPSYTLLFVMMFLMLSAKELVAERQDRTLARLMTSRATSLDLVLGFFLGGLVLGLVQSGLLLALNMLPPFRVDYGDSVPALVLGVLLFAAFCSAASVLLGCLARSGAQADGLGVAVTSVGAALGGLWWPLEIVPPFMRQLGQALPTGQAISIFHDLIGRGYGVAEVSGWLLGLLAWFVVVLALAVWRLRRLVAA